VPSRHLRRRRRHARGFSVWRHIYRHWMSCSRHHGCIARGHAIQRAPLQAAWRRQRVCPVEPDPLTLKRSEIRELTHYLPAAPCGLVRRSLYGVSASYMPVTSRTRNSPPSNMACCCVKSRAWRRIRRRCREAPPGLAEQSDAAAALETIYLKLPKCRFSVLADSNSANGELEAKQIDFGPVVHAGTTTKNGGGLKRGF